MKKILLFVAILTSTHISFAENINIAVLSPMVAEGDVFTLKMKNVRTTSIGNRNYYVGYIDNKKVVQTITGIGKVNAAIAAVNIIENFRPKLILLEGTAGAINDHLKVGTVVVGKQVYALERDSTKISNQFNANPKNLIAMPAVFLTSDTLLNKINKEKNIPYPLVMGKIATSDNLPCTVQDIKTLKKDNTDVIEMEGAAVMQVAWIYKIPSLVIRSNSNAVSADSDKPIFTKKGLQISTENAADFTQRVIENPSNTY